MDDLQTLMEDEPEKYQTHFSDYIKAGVDPDNIEELYKKVHSAIRADPTPKKIQKQPPKEHKRYYCLNNTDTDTDTDSDTC